MEPPQYRGDISFIVKVFADEYPLHEILSEYPALPYEVKRLETFSIIILLIKHLL